MNVYMTEEEQIALIKNWWNKYGNFVMVAIIVVMLLISGYRFWSAHDIKVKSQASGSYEMLMQSVANGDDTGIAANANNLIANYPKSVYAQIAALVLAKKAVMAGNYNLALQHLNKVITQHNNPALQQIARIRAARIQAALQAYPEAIALLGKIVDGEYLPLIYEVRGDIYLAAGDKKVARQNYALALQAFPDTTMASPILRIKLNDLNGAPKSIADTTSSQEFEHRII